VGQRPFQISDRLRLGFPEPRLVERRQRFEAAAKLNVLCDPVGERFGLGKPNTARLRGVGSSPSVKY
jgi:hypothetical protein